MEARRQLCEPILSFRLHMGSRDKAQVLGLYGRPICPLSHLVRPLAFILHFPCMSL